MLFKIYIYRIKDSKIFFTSSLFIYFFFTLNSNKNVIEFLINSNFFIQALI